MKTKLLASFFSIVMALGQVQAGNWSGFTTYSNSPEEMYQGIKTVNAMGMRITRVSIINMAAFSTPFNPAPFANASVNEYLAFISTRLDWLDQAMARAVSDRIPVKVVICLWNASGAVDNINDADVNNDDDAELRNFISGKMTQAWRMIFARYQVNSNVEGYDIINEPRSTGEVLSKFYRHMVNVQASVRGGKTLIFEPKLGRSTEVSAFTDALFSVAKSSNAFISPHIYTTGRITYQGMNGLNTSLAYTTSERDLIYSAFNQLESHRKANGYKIWVGECSCSYNSGWTANSHNQKLWANDVLAYFKSKGWEWCWHDANAGSVWSPFVPYLGGSSTFDLNSPTAKVLRLYK